MHTHSLSEWAAFLSLGVGGYAALSAPYFVFVDAGRTDFPRLWQAAVYARHDLTWALASGQHYGRELVTNTRSYARLSLRDTAFTATALLILLTTSPKGALR